MTTKMHIRWMIRRDIPEVLQIEQDCFECPWEEENIVNCLRQRNCIGLVAENASDKVVAFMIYEMYKHRFYIIRLAVGRPFRRQGFGAGMVANLVSKLSKYRRRDITVYVRETKLESQLFLRAQGFKAIEVVRSGYEEPDEDAYLMRFRMHEEWEPVNRIAKYYEEA